MEIIPNRSGDILPANPIRVETALSRYPVHRLAKHGNIAIDIREKTGNGEVSIKWEVTHSPGPLAYKLDTLIINRRIEEATRPIPRIIRLGSLREITEELGLSTHNDKIRKSLHQNASTYITAKIRYKTADGAERKLEAGFTRYSVVLTGEEMPDGRKADAVYIVLNDVFMQVINGAMTRPLDYDYLKSLPPAPQRFYELLSFQMYAAIKNDRPRAKLTYSELCKYAPLVRSDDWNIVRPQLARIHAPHKKSGYIGKIDFQDTVDADGQPDWIMLYQPGPKARAEFRAFTKKGGPVILETEPFAAETPASVVSQQPALLLIDSSPLERDLIGRGITAAIAAALVREHGEEAIQLQIDILESLPKKKLDKIDDPAAWLVTAIRNGHAAPKGYIPKAERERRAETTRQQQQADAEKVRQERERQAREKAERQAINAYWQSLNPKQQASLDAEVIAQADAEDRKLIEPGPMKRFGMSILRDRHIHQLLQSQGKLPVSEG